MVQKTIHRTKDKNHARRLTAMLMLHRGDSVSHVPRTLCCARSSVGRWINWFTLYGVEGLKSLPAGRDRRWPFEHICALFYEDEVDIHLNSKTGADWQLRGQQKRMITPGQNEKYYLAGALHSAHGQSQLCGRQQQEFIAFYQPVVTSEGDLQAGKNDHAHR
jgi:hypothetical protein